MSADCGGKFCEENSKEKISLEYLEELLNEREKFLEQAKSRKDDKGYTRIPTLRTYNHDILLLAGKLGKFAEAYEQYEIFPILLTKELIEIAKKNGITL